MAKRFLLIGALAFSFIFPVVLSGTDGPAGKVMANPSKIPNYLVVVEGRVPNRGVIRRTYRSNATTTNRARQYGIGQYKVEHPRANNVRIVEVKAMKQEFKDK